MKQITFHLPESTSKALGRKTLTGTIDGGDGAVEIEVAPDDIIVVPIRAIWGLAAVLDDEGRADTRPLTPRAGGDGYIEADMLARCLRDGRVDCSPNPGCTFEEACEALDEVGLRYFDAVDGDVCMATEMKYVGSHRTDVRWQAQGQVQ